MHSWFRPEHGANCVRRSPKILGHVLLVISRLAFLFVTIAHSASSTAAIMNAVHTGYYFTGDGALRDEDGQYRITGRVDDVINISGHRLGTAEVEDAMVGNYWSSPLADVLVNLKNGDLHSVPRISFA